MLSKEGREEVQRTYQLLLVLSSHSPGPASAGERSTGRGSTFPLFMSRLGLVYSTWLLHKGNTVPTSQGVKADLYLGEKRDERIRSL